MARLELRATTLEWSEHGSGQPVVFVHGSASDHRTWDQQLEAFAARYRVISYSRRYHWPNPPVDDDGEYAMADQVDDLEQMLRSLGDDPAHLVGHSYGGYLALMVAIKSPHLINRLVLAEPPVIPLFTSFPPKPQEILRLLVTMPRLALSIIRFAATGLGPATAAAKNGDLDAARERFGKAVLGSEAFHELSEKRMDQVRLNFSRAELLSDSFMTSLNRKDVANIETASLIVTGASSPPLMHRLADQLDELIPNTMRVDIPGASHIMHEDNPAAFNHAVLEFLQS